MKKTPFRRLVIQGFKAIREPQEIQIRPLTVIAGSNSAGKSSIMQPLLLLKQSIESSYDPGPLKLSGANVKFSSGDQLLTRGTSGLLSDSFSIGVDLQGIAVTSTYKWAAKEGFDLVKMDVVDGSVTSGFSNGSTHDQLRDFLSRSGRFGHMDEIVSRSGPLANVRFSVERDRSFYNIVGSLGADHRIFEFPVAVGLVECLKRVIHLPGLRGNPERTYPVSAVGGDAYPGLFQDYTASLIENWQKANGGQKLKDLSKDLKTLGLSWKVRAFKKNDTQVEIEVGRLPLSKRGGALDLVNIADVGLGVSQTLPLLVALQAATARNTVYIEQPEIHLHPRAQARMVDVIVAAVARGVTVIIETHSATMIRRIQTLVANSAIDPEDVSLNWFGRDVDGYTVVTHSTPDECGAYGQWPEDFDEVSLEVESEYLTAVEMRQSNRGV